VTADDFRKAKAETEDVAIENISLKKQEREQEAIDMKKKDRALKRKKLASSLSFNHDDEGDNSESNDLDNLESAPTIRKARKDPSAETSFLPDKERDMERLRERERLQQEWIAQQTVIKNEMLQITYSYWDGQGHRRVIQVRKGTTIRRYLELVKQQISTEFHDVRMISSENFLYIKEDLIIPHHFTFYDLIVTKARGKSGPLFHFDVHDDIRLDFLYISWVDCFGYLSLGCSVISVSFIICMLTLLLMPSAALHFCIGLDFVTPLVAIFFK
jgi:protein FAM50